MFRSFDSNDLLLAPLVSESDALFYMATVTAFEQGTMENKLMEVNQLNQDPVNDHLPIKVQEFLTARSLAREVL